MYAGSVAIISAYPAMVLGLIAGLVLARRSGTVTPALIAGSIAFALLVAHRSAGPAVTSPEGNGHMTPFLWFALAALNAGCWCLGVGMGVAARRPRFTR
jgi:hypothetical protein